MKNRALRQSVLLMVVMVLFVGCRTAPIFNVSDSTITTVSGKEPTLEEVTRAIVSASTASHPAWNMQVVKPGHIVATLHNRSHMAAVDINYTTNGYSITHKETANLKYNAEEETIHPNYNSWVQRLDSAIRTKLTML